MFSPTSVYGFDSRPVCMKKHLFGEINSLNRFLISRRISLQSPWRIPWFTKKKLIRLYLYLKIRHIEFSIFGNPTFTIYPFLQSDFALHGNLIKTNRILIKLLDLALELDIYLVEYRILNIAWGLFFHSFKLVDYIEDILRVNKKSSFIKNGRDKNRFLEVFLFYLSPLMLLIK